MEHHTNLIEVYNKAISLREIGAFIEAIDLLEDAIVRFPKDATLQAVLSHCYLLTDDIANAKAHLIKAKKIDHTLACVGWTEARLCLKQNNAAEAVAIARNTYKKFPNDVDGLGVLGACLRANKEIQESLYFLNKAIELNPNYAEAFINRGSIWLLQKDKVRATLDFERAHKIKPHIKQIWDVVIGLKIEGGSYYEAISVIIRVLEIDPNYQKAFQFLLLCNQKADDVNLDLFGFKKILEIRPTDVSILLNFGLALERKGDFHEAMEAYKKVLSINPNSAESYENIGNLFVKKRQWKEAKEAYEKALALKPDLIDARNNIGNILAKSGDFQGAIEAFRKAVDYKPNFPEAHNNMGNAFYKLGMLKQAIDSFNRAVSLKPEFYDSIEDFLNLDTQLLGSFYGPNDILGRAINDAKTDINCRPKYKIITAINKFLRGNINDANQDLNDISDYDLCRSDELSPRDKVFFNAYRNFLNQLIINLPSDILNIEPAASLFHLGDSHCLSYAHRNFILHGSTVKIYPKITFGAKAYHFAQLGDNSFKAITKVNLKSIPRFSNVFISFGEIDCRANEGFIPAALKLNKPIKDLISQTVSEYLNWFFKVNSKLRHKLFFLNLPAPVYDKRIRNELNLEVLNAILIFNEELKKSLVNEDGCLVDIYKFTADRTGYSNLKFHIDDHHLGGKALFEIEKQVCK